MKKFSTRRSAKKLVAFLGAAAIISTTVLFDACQRHTRKCNEPAGPVTEQAAPNPQPARITAARTLSSVVTVANILSSEGQETEVIFNENTQFFRTADASVLAVIKEAFSSNKAIQITFDPWQGVIFKAMYPSADVAAQAARGIENGTASLRRIDLATTSATNFDEPSSLGVINATEPGLTGVIPDFATAQLMFDYIAHQCCQLPGPYAIDYCIPFQYCIDGCYARAHKMCFIINKRYRYATKKIFSFANVGNDKLCVQGQKWGGCCINWWYHVAPLVTVNTPTGPKAYVFDPAMFNQPVLLSVWLHAQENPSCVPAGKVPNVSMINIRPTSSYTPSGSSGMSFSTDPTYSATNSTLTSYRYLQTCP